MGIDRRIALLVGVPMLLAVKAAAQPATDAGTQSEQGTNAPVSAFPDTQDPADHAPEARAEAEEAPSALAEPPTPPAGAPNAQCFPPCRAGFLCHQGLCVSACNPPCPTGNVCTASGECIAETSPPPIGHQPLAPALEAPEEEPAPREHSVVLDTSIYSTGDSSIGNFRSLLIVAPIVRGHFEVGRRVTLAATLPFVHARGQGLPQFGAPNLEGFSSRNGNPTIDVLYARRTLTRLFEIGGGIALPLASFPEVNPFIDSEFGPTEEQAAAIAVADAYSGALAVRGLWDPWTFTTDTVSLVAPMRWRQRRGGVEVGVDGALAFLVSTDDSVDDETTVLAQVGTHVGYASDVLLAGGRVRHVVILDSDINDQHQASLEPFIEARAGAAVLGGGFLINLDEPLGVFGANGADVWAIRLMAGGAF